MKQELIPINFLAASARNLDTTINDTE